MSTISTQDTAACAGRIADRLFPHQVEGVAFLLKRRRAILADDMGLGKTRQAIIGMHVAEPGGPFLVVCPASVKQNWAREITTALPGATVRVITGKSDDAPLDAEWVVVNYDLLGAHSKRLMSHGWRGVVFDEAHVLRNHQSQRSRHARALVAATDDPVVYALTGTPLTNRPRDLFALLQLCAHAMGKSFLSFAKRYCAAYQNEYGWVTDGASNLDELAVQLQGLMLRRTKDDVLDLPPKLRTWLDVQVPAGTGAYRIGQTNTVHATYMSASGTVDDFVTTLLRAKAALVDAVVEGRALDPDAMNGNVLDELQRLLSALSPHLAATPHDQLDEHQVRLLLRQAGEAAERDRSTTVEGPDGGPASQTDAMKQALRLLEQALAGPQLTKYRVASSSKPGQSYGLTVDAAGDVACDCPGFGYRGQCSHARTLKTALAKGKAVPAEYLAA